MFIATSKSVKDLSIVLKQKSTEGFASNGYLSLGNIALLMTSISIYQNFAFLYLNACFMI